MDIQYFKNQADVYLENADFGNAIRVYEQCLELSPDDISIFWYLGLCWLLWGDAEKCHEVWFYSFANIDSVNEGVVLSEFIDLLKYQGQKFLKTRCYDLAQTIYEAILSWDDGDLDVYYNLGHAVANQGDLETAISYWQTVTEVQPDYLAAHLHQAYIWQKLENFTAAIASYQNAISLSADHLTYYQLGLCYLQIQSWDLAKVCFLESIRQSIKIKNNYAPAYSDLGFVFLHQGDFLEAVNFLQQAIQIQPDFSQQLANISEASLLNLKDSVFRGINLIKSLQNSPLKITEVYLCLQKLIVNLSPEISLPLLEEILNNEPRETLKISASLEISDVLYNQNQSSEAIAILEETLEQLIDVYPDAKIAKLYAKIYFNLGKCWLQLAEYQQAISHLQKSLEINANFTEAYYLLAVALFQTGNFQEAINILKQQLVIEPNSPLSLAYLGYILAYNQNSIQNFEEALFYFQKAIAINSAITPLVDELLSNLIQVSDFDISQIKLIIPPCNFYESTLQWLENENLLTSNNYLEIYPETDIKLTPPQSLNDEIHFSFRFGNVVKLPASYVVKIPQGRFWLSSDQTTSAIIVNESHFLADLSPHFPLFSPHHPDKTPSQHPILATAKLPPLHFFDGKVVVLAGLTNHVYFHWMLDVLPRWELLRLSNLDFSEVDYFVVDNRLPFQRETLDKLQIPENKQINISQISHLQATQLIVPSFPGCVAWMSNWTCTFLKKLFLKTIDVNVLQRKNNKKRIYVTRKLAKSRRIINEDVIFNILASLGFESVILESLSVTEQAVLFSQAEFIVSPHGSGLTNLVFCQPGTKVIELFSPNYVYHCYWWVSNLVGLDYYYLIGEMLPGWYLHNLVYPQEFAEDIFIDIAKFAEVLQVANVSF